MKTVIRYIAGSYLPITETWIYGQTKSFKRYGPVVYALKTENLDIYPNNLKGLQKYFRERKERRFFGDS